VIGAAGALSASRSECLEDCRSFGIGSNDACATSLKKTPEPGTLNFAAESGNRFAAAGPAAALPYRLNGAQASL
jgi:hypothetical protein